MISSKKINSVPRIQRPIRILQFGAGNFLRGFIDWMVEVLNQQTTFNGDVLVVKPTQRGDYAQLRSQSGLFHVVLSGTQDHKEQEEIRLIQCVQQVIHPYRAWEEFLKSAENETIQFIISNTTEAGIRFNPEDKWDNTALMEFPAKLTSWLYRRFQHFKNPHNRGCIILPCELVENNGELLKGVVLQYARHWELGDDFVNWINTSNTFYNTLVDRIVSGYPAEKVYQYYNELGYEDQLIVAGEYYHSWVIEASEAVKRALPFEETNLNVKFVNDLEPYRKLKVRVLNGAHTAMVPIGLLARLKTVKDCMDNEAILNFIAQLLSKEIAPTLNMDNGEVNRYIQDTVIRFKNPSLQHKLKDISLNSTAKFTTRLLPSIKDYMKTEQKLPRRLVFAFSGLLVLHKEKEIALKDDSGVLKFLDENWNNYKNKRQDIQSTVNSIISNSNIWGEDLSKLPWFKETVSDFVDQIENNGILSALKTLD